MNESEFCACGEPAEWYPDFCQECWEAHCSRNFWQMVGAIYTAASQAEAESLGEEPTEVW